MIHNFAKTGAEKNSFRNKKKHQCSMKHLILPWLETAMENIDQYETGATYLRKILTFVNARGKKNLPVTEKILKTLKISDPYSVVLGNHITIKLPHDSHIPSLLKVLAYKRNKVSLHKMMGTWGCHQSSSFHLQPLHPAEALLFLSAPSTYGKWWSSHYNNKCSFFSM